MRAPRRPDRYTLDDLLDVPDDGRRYEVLNGSLVVTPPAGYPHNRRAQSVGLALLAAVPADREVLMTGTQAVALDDGDAPCPDVLSYTPGDFTVGMPAAAVLLIVEVTSPGNRRNDTVTKMQSYARAGIPHYWVVDPDRVSVYALEAGAYHEVASGGRVCATEPFPVTVDVTS